MVVNVVENGSITSPHGFKADATAAGVKYENRLDLGIVVSERPAAVAGMFTRNAVRSAPVQLSAARVAGGSARAIIANSGCANACTGERGLLDAETMAAAAAARLGIPASEVLVASTGVIGTFVPLDRVAAGVSRMNPDREKGHSFARAIMTTDTTCKEIAVTATVGGCTFTIGAAAKGSGMIHPNMGTMLCFITTDAAVEPSFLSEALSRCVDRTLNMVTVDGDTSPSDTVVVLANGLAGNGRFDQSTGAVFEEALGYVCEHLAKAIASDGEGATRLLEVTVTGARSDQDARVAARTIASSALVKAAINGADPNWGRVVCAAGRSGAAMEADRVSMTLGGTHVMSRGMPVPFDEHDLRRRLEAEHVVVTVDLGLGTGRATAWGCDLSHDYVTINASYTT
ncbi:MAG: bifunctional glutamate N-acetyltransferase/amino-acid acetyltransferase ArgJ [Dehalococcoidia bacterium]|nr:bifunctional glutamate N-acetyltransferase/amino-acid acetyltransferase ArgJ [Dehalococcoidia bacterium]